MKKVKTRTRVEWVILALGEGRHYTEGNFRKAKWRLMERGLIIAADAAGQAYERVAAVRQGGPAAELVKAYIGGQRRFRTEEIQGAVEGSIFSHEGMLGLAAMGFAIMRQLGDQIELFRIDTRAARFINEARLGPQVRGFSVRRVVEGMLCLRPPNRRRVNITDDRRLAAAEQLAGYGIDCEDILTKRLRVRLVSRWTLKRAA